ncbi:MAG: DUF1674 domain-containing protein [Pseudomonadota bacterium]
MTDETKSTETASREKRLAEAAERALSEAKARHAASPETPDAPAEIDGRDGPEPTRYGDWEKKGLISDF